MLGLALGGRPGRFGRRAGNVSGPAGMWWTTACESARSVVVITATGTPGFSAHDLSSWFHECLMMNMAMFAMMPAASTDHCTFLIWRRLYARRSW